MAQFDLKEGSLDGTPLYIVGGGESLRLFDWSLLQGREKVLVINRAFLNVPDASFWFSEDLRVVELYGRTPEWRRFGGKKIFHALKPSFATQAMEIDPAITPIIRTREDKFWSRRFREGLSISSNSGVGAINLAWLLGADPIYLLGFDCVVGNFHDDYVKAGFDEAGPIHMNSYKSDFEHWVAPHVRDRRIINLVDQDRMSALECWPRVDRDLFLKHGQIARYKRVIRDGESSFEVVEVSSGTGRGSEAAAAP